MDKTLLFWIVYHGRGKMYIIFLWEAWAEDRGKQRPPAPPSGRRAVDQAVSSSSVLGLHQADAAILLP